MKASTLPCLVMIPGTLCDERLFARQARAMRGVARVVVLDYRHLKDRETWLLSQLRQLPERFSLAGFSLGGIWALELLRRAAPERIERLAMIASNAEAGGARARRRSARLWRRWRRVGPEALAAELLPGYFHHPARARSHARLVRDMAARTSTPAARAQFAWAATRPAGYEALSAWARPLLIVSGARDRLCGPALQRRMLAAHPQASWVELPRCGHFVPLEAPTRLSRLLVRWFQTPNDFSQQGIA